ncbi:MAG: hypothetical protein V4527_18150 [Pseudomonadota bacterium]
MTLTLTIALLIAAFVLFVIDTAKGRSLTSAGLACATLAFLVPLIR